MDWLSLLFAGLLAVASAYLFRAWRRAPTLPYAERTWLTDWQSRQLAIYGYVCGVFAVILFIDFLGLPD